MSGIELSPAPSQGSQHREAESALGMGNPGGIPSTVGNPGGILTPVENTGPHGKVFHVDKAVE